jgi:hypothetical protein
MNAQASTICRWLPEERPGRENGRFIRRASARKRPQAAVAFSNKSSHLAFCGRGRLKILHRASRTIVADHRLGDGLSWLVEKIIFAGMDTSLVIVHADGAINCIENPFGQGVIRQTMLFNTPSLDMDACKQHSLAVVGGENGRLYIFDPLRFEETQEEVDITDSMIGSISLSEDGRLAAVCSNWKDAVLVRIGLLDGRPSYIQSRICAFEGPGMWTWGCVITTDATRAVTGTVHIASKEGVIRMWDLDSGKGVSKPIGRNLKLSGAFYTVSGDASLCICLDETQTMLYYVDLYCYAANTMEPRVAHTFNSEVCSVTMGKGGLIACATIAGDIIQVDVFAQERRILAGLTKHLPIDILSTVKAMIITAS